MKTASISVHFTWNCEFRKFQTKYVNGTVKEFILLN